MAIYLTVLEKEQHKKIYITLKICISCNHVSEEHVRKILAYRFSKLACGGGSVYIKAIYNAY